MTATPERNTAAQNAFGALLDAATEVSPTGVVAIGEAGGPRPFNPEEAVSVYGPCKHCSRTIHDGSPTRGYMHRDDHGYTSKSRCNPDESGLPYGYNAEPIGQPCANPCIGTKD